MAGAIEAGIDLKKATKDLDRNQSKLESLKGILQQKVDTAVRETAEEFRDEVQNQIKASEIDSDTGELLNSWRVIPKGIARYQVRSTVDYAVFLELGTSEHEIRGHPSLVFQPEPGTYGEYPDDAKRGDGWVQMRTVNHPGNEAYQYFEAAENSRSWKTTLNNKLRKARDEAIEEAGF
jgi:hypothetical protein